MTVSDVGDVAPIFTSASSASFVENATGAAYTAVAVSDVTGAAVSYSISGGADSAKFSINSSSGVVRFVSSPDFDTLSDADSNNVYDIVITATEANNTNTVTQSVAVTVTDVGDVAPVFSSAAAPHSPKTPRVRSIPQWPCPMWWARVSASASAAEPTRPNSASTAVGWSALSAARTMNQRPMWAATMFMTSSSAPTEAGNTHTVTQSVAVTVTDVGDVAPVFTSANSASFAENGNGAVYTAVATPDVTGAVVSYSISGGLDSARFSIDSSSGVVSFVSVPDFEIPADSDSNNSYQFVVSATEAGNTFVATRSLTVTVSNVVVEGSTFTSASSASFVGKRHRCGSIPQWRIRSHRVRRCHTASAAGPTRPSSASTAAGWSALSAARTSESPTDSGSNNVYNLEVKATEAGNTNTTTHSVAVTVTDVGDVAPSFTSASSASFVENATGAAYTAVAVSDVTGAAVSYSISGGADSAKFSINSSSGVMRFVSSPDFETPASAASSNVYDIVITATEANNTNTVTQSVAVTVTDVGDVAPVFSSASSATFAENATGAVYTAVAVSDVMGASISFSISGGADSAKFSINSSGVVSFVSSPNHESATDVGGNNVYDIVIRATEAGNTHTVTQSVAVTVTDVGDVAPIFSSASSASFAENGNGGGLYRSGHPRCDRCSGVVQHQRRVGLGQIQHQQQQRCRQLYQRSRL